MSQKHLEVLENFQKKSDFSLFFLKNTNAFFNIVATSVVRFIVQTVSYWASRITRVMMHSEKSLFRVMLWTSLYRWPGQGCFQVFLWIFFSWNRVMVVVRSNSEHKGKSWRPLPFMFPVPCGPRTPLHKPASAPTLALKSPIITSLSSRFILWSRKDSAL